MKQGNVCKRYDITHEELQKGVDQISKLSFGKFAGDINVLLAIVELLTAGDIDKGEENTCVNTSKN